MFLDDNFKENFTAAVAVGTNIKTKKCNEHSQVFQVYRKSPRK